MGAGLDLKEVTTEILKFQPFWLKKNFFLEATQLKTR